MAPDEAVKIFNMLSPLGDVPVDNLDENGCSAMHIRQLKPESYYGQPKFAVLLAKYGADLLCSVSDCRTCESVHDMVQAAHEKWKAEASKKVLENIPVMALKDLVINCCFAKPKNLRLLYHSRLR
jgi:hypothetical protein